jgi:hypothetical protein
LVWADGAVQQGYRADSFHSPLMPKMLGAIFKSGMGAWNFIEGQRYFIAASPLCMPRWVEHGEACPSW